MSYSRKEIIKSATILSICVFFRGKQWEKGRNQVFFNLFWPLLKETFKLAFANSTFFLEKEYFHFDTNLLLLHHHVHHIYSDNRALLNRFIYEYEY